MTSNVGADLIRKAGSLGFKTQKEEVTYQDMKDKLLEAVKHTFKPEFLNRIDDIIVFKSLTKENLHEIVQIEIDNFINRLKEKGIKLGLSEDSFALLIEKGFDPVYGARPLKRTIQRLLEDPLAEDIISRRFKEGSEIKVERQGDGLVFK
jgi:ATP-dependent Clp protease ATP-binding subunit ClpC